MTQPRRPSTVGLLVGLALGMAVGFALGITVALTAFPSDPAPAAPGRGSSNIVGSLTSGGVEEPRAPATGSTLGRQELDDCLRAAGIDPAGPRPTGSILCSEVVPRGSPGVVDPGIEDPAFTTAPPLTVAPTSR